MTAAYNPAKAAQVLAYLVQGRGGQTSIIDLIKLTYLSDRTFMEKYDRPILYDDLACLDYGPVNSKTYDSIKLRNTIAPPWSDYLRARSGDTIALARALKDRDFDLLSVSEERVIKEVLQKHEFRRSFELVEWVHVNCREWSNPRGTSSQLPYFEVFKALGKDDIGAMHEHITEICNLSAFGGN